LPIIGAVIDFSTTSQQSTKLSLISLIENWLGAEMMKNEK
jgi:hypothetical protein